MAANAAEEIVQINGRARQIFFPEIEQKLRVCPTAEQYRDGFSLQPEAVDTILTACQELTEGMVFADASYNPDQNLDMLVRTVRILQVGMGLQLSENAELTEEFNKMQEDLADLEERERRLQLENDQFRQRLDLDDSVGNPDAARLKIEELQRRLDLSKLEADTYADQSRGKDEKVIELEARQKSLQDALDSYRKINEGLESKLLKLTASYSDLQNTFTSMAANQTAGQSKGKIEDSLRQQDWKIERMIRDNRALELQNTELKTQLQDVKTENLEVSEKIVLLDEEVRKLRLGTSAAEARSEQLLADKESLMSVADELRSEVQEKINIMDEFQEKFARQFRSWEEEKANLMAHIESLKRDLKGLPGRRTKSSAGHSLADGSEADDELQDLRDEVEQARENEVLLLEAYEQLELDCAREIDKALAKEREERGGLDRKVLFLQAKLDEERNQVMLLKHNHEQLEDDIRGYKIRNRQYEEGLYGLPQAVDEIHALKEALYKEEGRVRGLVDQVNKLSSRLEDVFDENSKLRRAAGLGDTDKVDIKDVRMQKEAQITQLRSLNALLERQVADLEEERRKLRMEMKFRAKYHGQAALELGLTPEQLLLLEQYVEGMKHGTLEEARLVDQLTKRIEFLEVRLSEVMAYADIPPSMRPALSEYDPVSLIIGKNGNGGGMGGNGEGAGLANIKAAQVEAIKQTILKSLSMLREVRQSLAEKHSVSDAEYQKYVENVMSQLTDAEQALDAMIKDMAKAAVASDSAKQNKGQGNSSAAGSSAVVVQGGPVEEGVFGDANFLADEVADQLRSRLKELAKQLADLQVDVATKDAQIKALQHQKLEIERKFGVPMSERNSDYVPRADYDDQTLEVHGLREQLVNVLEELAARERELAEEQEVHHRYLTKMQTYTDQVKLLYREHATALKAWKTERGIIEKKVHNLQMQVDSHKAAEHELRKGLDAIQNARTTSDLQKEVISTARRMAVVQVKHAKLARELEASVLSERSLQSQVEEVQEEVRDVSTTCRARIRWLEATSDQANRRVEQLFRELQASAPLISYRSIVHRHARLQGEARRLVEEQAEAVLSVEDVVEMRHELVEMKSKYDKTSEENSELREQKRQLQQQPSSARALEAQVSQELVASRVLQEATSRRMAMVEGERDRVQRSLREAQDHAKDLEQRLSSSAAELSMAHSTIADLEGRLTGCLVKVEADALVLRLNEAEEAASKVQAAMDGLAYRVRDAEKRLAEAVRDRQRLLSEITTLKAALRDVASRSEQAAIIGKMHMEVDHLRSKEGLARNALNRSEVERIELDNEIRRLRQEGVRLGARLSAHQDQARWADKQRHETQVQLEIGLQARTEQWKARVWARKLEQYKVRNDAAADGLDLARRRIKRLEDSKEAAELKLELKEEVDALSKRNTSEVVREAARLNEVLVQLRLERGKLQREEVLLREKVHYVERVNAELHELLERYEAEFFQHQLQLEGDRQAEATHGRLLQDEVVRLQERIAAILASGGGPAGKSDADGQRDQDLKSLRVQVGTDGAARLKDLMSAHTASDREIMLRQIEALKLARQEAESAKLEVGRLSDELTATVRELADVRRHHNDALARLRDQSEAMLYAVQGRGPGHSSEAAVAQMKAVAEATINELKNRLDGRDKALKDLQALLDLTKEQWLAQHQTDREEISRLNQALFERNNASIDNLKGLLNRLPGASDSGSTTKITTEEYERLKDLADRRQDEINMLRNQLEQKDAAIDVIRNNYELQIRSLEAEIARLQNELAKPRDDAPSRVLAEKLQAELKRKDERLRKLDAAIKQIQVELTEALKRRADEAMQGANAQQLSRLEDEVQKLQDKNRELLEAYQVARDALTACQQGDNWEGREIARLNEQVGTLQDQVTDLERDLAQERDTLSRFKNAERTVVDLTTGMSIEAKRQIEELQRRVHTLERQNQQLKKTLTDEGPAGGGGDEDGRDGGGGSGGSGGGPGGGGGGGRGHKAGTQARPGSSGSGGGAGPPPPAPPAPDIDASGRSATAVAHWEETKRLQSRLEALRKKMATKTEEAAESQREAERLRLQGDKMQVEMDKQSTVIRDLNERLKKVSNAPKLTQESDLIKKYVDRNLELEKEVQQLRLQLQSSQPRAAASSAPTDSSRHQHESEELFQVRLARDVAEAQVARLKSRLDELFGPRAGATGGGASRRVTGSSSSAPALMSAREAELMSTITNLKLALEKATAGTVPNTKYMAEVTKRKDAQREAATTTAELDRIRSQGAAYTKIISELQAANAQLRATQASRGSAADAAAKVSGAGSSTSVGSQLASLEALLERREKEVAELRQALAESSTQMKRLTSGRHGAAEGSQETLKALRSQLAELEAENRDLKNELNAFDPAFFEEIEDMKHEHHQLSVKVQEYEDMVRELTSALGRPLPAGLRR
ncbi:hypothetical protein CEUSTIGMA_g2927.t1 [Chlamydomonas eustigma]|uniref:Centrosomal protein of 290kDa coiled-coil region domain-containing protein n=1 Tax=Chlamydomonas eustigma TaxID=1157962 RepID=A0A250WXC6_9CHLO|nr:hypothetical protein CEUSTIGMA_g2927.t1 [Chlamydomonas eustigma]|eukprot:GAX75484.1 hypothetical protein CEUSTIGMA_g2927.t1 [Chlamydomonas eustigma]